MLLSRVGKTVQVPPRSALDGDTGAPGPGNKCSSASSPLTVLDSLRLSMDILHGQLTQSLSSSMMNMLCSEVQRPSVLGSAAQGQPQECTWFMKAVTISSLQSSETPRLMTHPVARPPHNGRRQLLNTFCKFTRCDGSEYKTICN